MSTKRVGGLSVMGAVLFACGSPPESSSRVAKSPPTWRVRTLATPCAPGSGEPNLALAPDGGLLLSWIEPDGDGHKLRFAKRASQGEWSPPKDIVRGDDWFVNWADFPSMAVSGDGTLYAHWLQRSGEGVYSYDVRVAWSRDGGATWSEPMTPHDDGTPTEHGFVSMVPLEGDRVVLVWLDGRETAGPEGAGPAAHPRMTIRAGVLDSAGVITEPALLDDRVCECCQTSAARIPGGVVAVFRDRSEAEVRDISFVRSSPRGWTEAAPIAEDGWQIYGCPVNGPAVAAAGERAAVAWYGAPEDQPHVKVAFSQDAGASWGAPIRVDDGRPLGRVDVVLLEDGAAAVSWMEQLDSGAEVRLRRVEAAGDKSESLTVAGSSAARSTGFPRMERSGRELVLAWRDSGEPPMVRTAVVSLGGS